jgi:hypothetical protein
MVSLKQILFFVLALSLHLSLLCLFSTSFYILYFTGLFFGLYLLSKYYVYFSHLVFFILTILTTILINLNIYDEYIFEISLWLNLIDKIIYVNSEIMYALSILHLLFLINLKLFDNFWVIIDEKLFSRD